MPKPTRPTVAAMHKRLQPVFNHFVRLRDTKVYATGERWGNCISCGILKPYAELQAGHFVPEQSSYYLRYNELNVNSQCAGCNKWKHGNPFGYMIGLAEKIGEKEVFELVRSRTNKRKYSVENLTQALEHYQQKIKEME